MTVATQHWQGLEAALNRPRPKDVRTSPPITFTPGQDFFRTDRGITWGIKVTSVGDIQAVHVFEKSGDTWAVGTELAGLGWTDELKDYGGDVKTWFKAKALPRLNAWLAQRFPATSAPPSGDPSEQLDRLIVGTLRVQTNPDGTLSASLG